MYSLVSIVKSPSKPWRVRGLAVLVSFLVAEPLAEEVVKNMLPDTECAFGHTRRTCLCRLPFVKALLVDGTYQPGRTRRGPLIRQVSPRERSARAETHTRKFHFRDGGIVFFSGGAVVVRACEGVTRRLSRHYGLEPWPQFRSHCGGRFQVRQTKKRMKGSFKGRNGGDCIDNEVFSRTKDRGKMGHRRRNSVHRCRRSQMTSPMAQKDIWTDSVSRSKSSTRTFLRDGFLHTLLALDPWPEIGSSRLKPLAARSTAMAQAHQVSMVTLKTEKLESSEILRKYEKLERSTQAWLLAAVARV
ncbi:hypothetical protein K438DRAFT_1892260 [Mycena galopus ATCC 62051]|nr:hypothetical protein K438DRAFT_1892260 [Mycena galopus ATCC 62051]